MNIDNIKKMNDLNDEKEKKEQELENIKDEIAEVRKNCEHIPVKVANLQIDNVAYCLFCGKRVTRQRNYFVDAHDYKKEKYGDGFSEKDRVDRLHDLQNIAVFLYEEGNTTNEQLSEELKKYIQESNNETESKRVLKNVLGKWVGLWMPKR